MREGAEKQKIGVKQFQRRKEREQRCKDVIQLELCIARGNGSSGPESSCRSCILPVQKRSGRENSVNINM